MRSNRWMQHTLLALTLLVLAACGQQSEQGGDYAMAPESTYEEAADLANERAAEGASMDGNGQAPGMPEAEAPAQAPARLVIYTANMNVQVEELDSSSARAKRLVQQAGGYVASESIETSYGYRNTLSFRVPVGKFDELLAGLEGVGIYTQSKSVNAQDVTEEFVDNEARLKAKRAMEEQYLEVLRRANTVSDILEVRQYLGRIREEIERIEGRQRFLQNRANYSTITLTLYVVQDAPTGPSETFWSRLGEGMEDGWDFLKGLVIVLFSLWPLYLIGAVLYVLLRGPVRRWRARRKAQKDD